MNEIPRVEAEGRRELARDARDLLNDRAFKAACALLRAQWYNELLDSKIDMDKLFELRAKLQVIEAIPAMIQKLVNDETMAQRAGHGRRY
jgi:hypothetical protein